MSTDNTVNKKKKQQQIADVEQNFMKNYADIRVF
jgi:hypothetical protein